MIISLIVAVDNKSGIGIEGRLPWKISSDLKRFKNLTMGHHLIMGRKTWESIGRALPGRTNIIVSKTLPKAPENTILHTSLQDGLAFAEQNDAKEVFIIGGGQIFTQALPIADRIYLSKVHTDLPADVYFPPIDWEEWNVITTQEIPESEKDQYAHTFMILERRREQSFI
jgi:dihydrofolate reductase